jgi:hypothetical protein
MLSPGIQWTAQELGGEWLWNSSFDKCLTSVQLIIAAAPLSAGNCTQIGYVTDNPGYDPNATVAAPLTHVATQAGPAGRAVAQSTPVQTKPTAAPVTAASSAPAGCYPLTDGGNCYQPGEHCRDDDHDVSDVAGNGKAIICEDNDGWRWEPPESFRVIRERHRSLLSSKSAIELLSSARRRPGRYIAGGRLLLSWLLRT